MRKVGAIKMHACPFGLLSLLLLCFLFAVNLAQSPDGDGGGPVADREVEIARLRERVERLEAIFNVTNFDPDSEEHSMIDLFARYFEDRIITSIPPTDPECSFNWLVGKCYPLCQCRFAPKLGDYSPTRACRLIAIEDRQEDCDPTAQQIPWFIILYSKVLTFIQSSRKTLMTVTESIVEKAPPSDAQCSWSWSFADFGCSPKMFCAFIPELGDYSLDRMCRLRVDDFDDSEDDSEAMDAHHEEEAKDAPHEEEESPVRRRGERTGGLADEQRRKEEETLSSGINLDQRENEEEKHKTFEAHGEVNLTM